MGRQHLATAKQKISVNTAYHKEVSSIKHPSLSHLKETIEGTVGIAGDIEEAIIGTWQSMKLEITYDNWVPSLMKDYNYADKNEIVIGVASQVTQENGVRSIYGFTYNYTCGIPDGDGQSTQTAKKGGQVVTMEVTALSVFDDANKPILEINKLDSTLKINGSLPNNWKYILAAISI